MGMISMRKKLKPGHGVRFAFNVDNVECSVQWLKENHGIDDTVWYKNPGQKDGFVLVEGFVTGDAGRGLSVVALGDETMCLLSTEYMDPKDERIARRAVSTGFVDTEPYRKSTTTGNNPKCAYRPKH